MIAAYNFIILMSNFDQDDFKEDDFEKYEMKKVLTKVSEMRPQEEEDS